ncbi:histone-arginine methyltransferase CARMER [Asbolus verrucosus]|uniref:type I protein arginine methyltransferase n=1 Tax=Asbolus verrucosus TaxID=1661398 RepID=A0A482W9T8_ASBVE|nr:histone-arginine methyltransferase CARMER [Asbolus verrucosus]
MALRTWEVEVFNVTEEIVCNPKYNKKVKLRADYDPQGISIKLIDGDDSHILSEFPICSSSECCRVGPKSYIFSFDNEALLFKFSSIEDARSFTIAITKVKSGKGASVFSVRTEDSSATQYFQFYGYLSQQQNMLQDFVRTYTYQRAILCNLEDFKDKVILDVGAGSGILSFFAAQAGAKRIYAVEASTMAHFAQKLVEANNLSDSIKVIPGKIEEIELPEKVDVIISEPMGYMLYNERMLETYLHAKKWLSPGGKMYPSRGDLHIAPFTDDSLYMEQYNIPLEFHILESGTCHGLAFWFDVAFAGSQQTIWLSTGPTEPLTHWYQVRCLLEQPLLLKQGQVLTGRVLLVANKRQSYDVTIDLAVEGTNQSSKNTLDLKNPYFRYTGAPVQPPPGISNVSPSENYWSQLDAQGVRNGIFYSFINLEIFVKYSVNMVNGMSVNGLGEVSMDTTQTIINSNMMANNLIALVVDPSHLSEATQPNIHPGCISSTGRGRVAASPTSTHTAQLIGGAISPSLFTSPNPQQQQPLVMTNYPVSANLMIGDYVTPGNGVAMPAYRQ